MFCHKCGNQAAEGAAFCSKCGAKLMVDDAARQTAAPVPAGKIQPRGNGAQAGIPHKKKSGKLPVILGIAAVVIVAVIAMVVSAALNREGKTDYEATVRAYTPYANSQGLPYTCGEVFDQYIPDAKWNIRKSGDGVYVDISGAAKGTKKKLVITMQVEAEGDRASIDPVSAVVDGRETSTQKDTEMVFFAFFVAYDEGYGDLSDFAELLSQMEASSSGQGKEGGSSESSQSEQWKAAYAGKIRELAAEENAPQFALIDLTGSDIPQLAADYTGYSVSVFTWTDGALVTLMDWPYGAMGNLGYEYLPGRNVIRNFNNDQAGALVYESYMTVNDSYEVVDLYGATLNRRYFKDANGNGMMDGNEPYSETPYCYYGDTEITEEEYAGYQIQGEYEPITGELSAEAILTQLTGN